MVAATAAGFGCVTCLGFVDFLRFTLFLGSTHRHRLQIYLGKHIELLSVVLAHVVRVEERVQEGADVHQMQLPQEVLHLIILSMFLDGQLVNLHRGLLVQLVASDVPTHYLQRAAQLTNLADDTVLLVLDQDILVPRV